MQLWRQLPQHKTKASAPCSGKEGEQDCQRLARSDLSAKAKNLPLRIASIPLPAPLFEPGAQAFQNLEWWLW